MSTSLETQIIKLLEEGNQQALNLLYEHYSDALYGVIYKITKNDELAEDALQETFIKVWRYADKYDADKAKLFTWLYRIARNTAIDKLRSYNLKHQKNIQIDHTNVYVLPTTSLNQDVLDLKAQLEKIEEKYQVVIKALYFEGMTQEEASKELDMPLGTIKSRLKIGLRELKKFYN